jgi:transcriptional regulator with XRE-family HTH domain
MTTQEYVAAIRQKLGITSDYALAKALGVTKQAAGRWTKGLNGFDDESARRAAAILEIHPGLVMIDIHRERAKDTDTRALWHEIFQGFQPLLPHAKTVSGFALLW